MFHHTVHLTLLTDNFVVTSVGFLQDVFFLSLTCSECCHLLFSLSTFTTLFRSLCRELCYILCLLFVILTRSDMLFLIDMFHVFLRTGWQHYSLRKREAY